MKVARSLSTRSVALEDVDEPRAGHGEVVCRMVACGVCKSDVTDWYVEPKLPAVLGHELVGEVEALGGAVAGVRRGELVAIQHHTPCGECRRCRRGHETMCERFRSVGLDPGGFAERVRVPAVLVPRLLPLGGLDPVAATWTEPLACVLRSQDRAGVKPGDTLLVVGAGANGLLQIAAARARGIDAVLVLEPREDRLALATAIGATRHEGQAADVAIVCTPEPAAIAAGAEALDPGGVLCLYAPPRPGTPLPIDGDRIFRSEIEVRASFSAGYGDMRSALEMLRTGRVDPLPLISHRMALAETGQAFELTRSGHALKAVIVG